jgi:hypothetical protein
MFFFTQVDPRAAVKGSRDPLGLQPIWTSFGRQVIGNLTTVTTSVKNFATLLVGLYFADQTISSGQSDEQHRADLFLKFEQIAAYSRYAYGEGDSDESPLGIRRVRRRFYEDGGRPRISANSEHQILSNQKTYGLWGLYSIAARQSGLLDPQENRLSPTALDFVESQYLPRLSYSGSKNGGDVLRMLGRDSFFEPKNKDRKLGRALAQLLGPELTAAERAFYEKTLVRGSQEGCNHTSGRQQQLWETLSEVNQLSQRWREDFGYEELTEACKRAEASGHDSLATALYSIHKIEPVLAVSHRLFGFLLRRNGYSLNEVAEEVRSQWGRAVEHINCAEVEALGPRISDTSIAKDSADKIIKLAASLRAGDYEGAARVMADQNAEVMKVRGGAPWLLIERNKLKVRLREESGYLPAADELPALWVNSYFINSLKSIGRKVAGKD